MDTNLGTTHGRTAAGITIIYDGDCPFCRAHVRLLRLRQAVGEVRFVDARAAPDVVRALAKRGLALDEGMVVETAGGTYFGAEAAHVLALLSTPSGLFNRLNTLVFRSKALSRIFYPVLRTGRALTLAALGIRKIAAPPRE